MMLSRWWLVVLAGPRFALCAMSDYQVARFAAVEARAEALSEAAKPELLRALDSGAFRSYLAACCPSYANWTADALLGTLVAETKRAEVCTGIPAGGGADAPGSSWSTSMEDAAALLRTLNRSCKESPMKLVPRQEFSTSWRKGGV